MCLLVYDTLIHVADEVRPLLLVWRSIKRLKEEVLTGGMYMEVCMSALIRRMYISTSRPPTVLRARGSNGPTPSSDISHT